MTGLRGAPTRHRIFNAEPAGYAPEAAAVLAEAGEVRMEEVDRRGLMEAVPWATALIVRLGHRVDDELMARAPTLRVVATATTGLDHVDEEAARRRGVAVLSLRGESEFLDTVHATAEHTWALALALARRIPWAHGHAVAGGWERGRFRGREMAGRALGVVGLGRVGRRVAQYGLAFGMRVAAYDPSPARWVEGVEWAPGLRELAAASDVLSVHVVLDGTTRGLIGADVLAALPQGALIVNTSRGAVIDEAALAAALESGRLGGAALDVLCGEPSAVERGRSVGPPAGERAGWPSPPAGERGPASPLVALARRRSDMLLTPHIGGATFESMARTEIFMARKLRRFCRDAPVVPETARPIPR